MDFLSMNAADLLAVAEVATSSVPWWVWALVVLAILIMLSFWISGWDWDSDGSRYK